MANTYERNIACRPLEADKADFFTVANAGRRVPLPVQLHATATDGFLPVVRGIKGETTAADRRPVFGLYVGRDPSGDVVTIRVAFDQQKVARHPSTAPAVLPADIGKGVVPAGTDGQNDGVIAGAALNSRGGLERWEIIGGNTTTGTAANPAFYTVKSTA